MRSLCIIALTSTLAATIAAAATVNAATAKKRDRETCTRIVSAHPLYQRPGGGLTEQAEASIQKCMRGEEFPLPQVDPRWPPDKSR